MMLKIHIKCLAALVERIPAFVCEKCVVTMRAYFAEAEKTTAMLAKCTVDPLPFADRLNMLAQEIVENESLNLYVGAKSLLHEAARLGYGSSN